MRIAHLAMAASMAALLAAGLTGLATGQGRPQRPPEFDYWQPDWMVRELWGPGNMPKGMMARLLRHTTYMQLGVPEEYTGKTNSQPMTADTISKGRELYANNCASCHGQDGLGDGDAANAVSPSPALLAYMIRRPVSVDEYLLWTISDGGKQFETAMPAFKGRIPTDDIWRIVSYMRAGFPVEDPATPSRQR